MAAEEWSLAPAAETPSRRLEAVLGISGVLARILCARGYTRPDDAAAYLRPSFDPASSAGFPGVAEAVAMLRRAQRTGRNIAVYGDYDADGVIGTAILRAALSRSGRRRGKPAPLVDYYIPDRSEEGYGLNRAAIYHLRHDRQVDLLLTVDCGIRGHSEVEYARSLGMQVIITDHHLPPTGQLPPADAIVHPSPGGALGCCEDASSSLYGARGEPCGALVALYLAYGLLGEVEDAWLDLATVATVADVVPLLGDNRGLVSERLPRLAETRNLGLEKLIARAGLGGRSLSSRDVAFGIAPRINAMGRVGDAKHAVEAFCTDLPIQALDLVERMEAHNHRRRQLEDEMLDQARQLLRLDQYPPGGTGLPDALVVERTGWYLGIVGIVAARLAREVWRPAAVIAVDDGIGYGSGRSVPGCDLHQAMSDCGPLLERFGGHRQAVGFRLPASRIPDFAVALAESVRAQGRPARRLDIDALVDLHQVDGELVRELARLEPVGQGNPAPVLGARHCQVVAARRVGADGSHLKLSVRQDGAIRDAIAFGQADQLAPICTRGAHIDLAFAPEINVYQGQSTIQLKVAAARRSDGPAGADGSDTEAKA